MSRADYPDPDDMFADSRMTFGEHIEDLRNHLLRAIYGFVAGMVIAFFFAKPILDFITAPVDEQVESFYDRYNRRRAVEIQQAVEQGLFRDVPPVMQKVWMKRPGGKQAAAAAQAEAVLPSLLPAFMGLFQDQQLDFVIDPRTVDVDNWEQVEILFPDPIGMAKRFNDLQRMINPPRLTTLSIQEPFVVFFKVALMAGFVIASPIVFWQLWAFVAAGLYPHEKRLVHVYLPFSLALFVIGVLACQFIVIPKAVAALLWFNEWLDLQPDLRLNEWLGFAIFMPVVFGLSFQTPLVMLFAYMIGIFGIDTYRQKRAIAFFFMAVFAAFITPSTDAFSMMFMWVPMCMLYEIGIWLCMFKRREEIEEWEDEPHELIEV